MRIPLVPLPLLLLAFAASAAESDAVLIEAIDGAETVEVAPAAGAAVQRREGEAVATGDRIRTGPSSSVRLLFADQTILAISTSSEAVLEDAERKVVRLEKGGVWGKVEKGAPAAVPSPRPRPYKFTLRSRAVVMGVRGTEFLVEEGEEATVTTLEGEVDTAPDLEALQAGRVTAVPALQRIRARRGGAWGTPEAFRKEDAVEHLRRRHSGLVRFLGRPVRAELREKRMEKREHRREELREKRQDALEKRQDARKKRQEHRKKQRERARRKRDGN